MECSTERVAKGAGPALSFNGTSPADEVGGGGIPLRVFDSFATTHVTARHREERRCDSVLREPAFCCADDVVMGHGIHLMDRVG